MNRSNLELETDRSECIPFARFLDPKQELNGEKICLGGVIFRFDRVGLDYDVFVVGKYENHLAASFKDHDKRERVMLKRLEEVAYRYN